MSNVVVAFLSKTTPFLNATGFLNQQLPILGQVRQYAARKGTRERRKKALKPKEEVVKETFQTKKQRLKDEAMKARPSLIFDDSWKPAPTDNVYRMKYFKWPKYSFEDAIKTHRETHHPEIYNKPNANVDIKIDLNMELPKKNKYADNIYRIAEIPFVFEHGQERRILGLSKDESDQENGKKLGADLIGGVEIIKNIQNGEISIHDFEYIIAHPNILPEIVSLRGLLKKKFPNPKNGTLDANFSKAIERFLHGISYSAVKDSYQKEFGAVEATIGTLNMETSQLEDNLKALLKDILEQTNNKKKFIRRVVVTSKPAGEQLMINHDKYIDENVSGEDQEEDEEVGEAIEAKN